jgi:undecaprenyl-diphosphatase
MARLTKRKETNLLIVLAVAAAAAMSMIVLDRTAARFIRDHSDSVVVDIASYLTQAGNSLWHLLAAGLLLIVCVVCRKGFVANRALFYFAAIATSGIAVNVLKVIFGRTRPQLYLFEQIYGFHWFEIGYNYNSFPSGHACTIGAATAAMWLLLPRWRWLWVAVGLPIALTRVALYAHYVSDVIVGVWFGAVWTLWLWRVFNRRGWLEPRAVPLRDRIAGRVRRLWKVAP